MFSGNNAGEINSASGHKKGHKVKGFKNSHQKLESGNTEEYYDEEHDEGGKYMAKGQAGSFGENAGSAFGGGKQNGLFKIGQQGNQGHYNSEFLADKANQNMGRYGEAKFGKSGSVYGLNNGLYNNNMAGHHMYNQFFKKHPFYHYYY